ncbi:MAG: ATP-grasp domain-containing protein [Myxococcales bacterium]|nr:MAG: ATP-grasp domain-containing protein [Myxococcales bacterium]
MSTKAITIAITGLNASDNPAPGVAVMRSIRHASEFSGQLVGLCYDSLDSGNFASELADAVFLMPYPREGIAAFEERLRYIHSLRPIDVFIPTLDSELSACLELEPVFSELGIRTFLPTKKQLELRSKAHLCTLGAHFGIQVPRTRVVNEAQELYTIDKEVPYPLFIKGVFYGAIKAQTPDEAISAFHKTVAQWGTPVVAQQAITGTEFDVVAVGDGNGGLVGAVPMRKTLLSKEGKGWAGITIKDPKLLELTEAFAKASAWRGPFEIEVMLDRQNNYQLMEINPRFPAWTYLSTGAGMNLPWRVVRRALGDTTPIKQDYRVGTLFSRIAIDQIVELAEFEQLVTCGELFRRSTEEAV